MAPVILFVFNFFYPVDLRPLADYVTAQSCRALSAPLCHFWRRAFVSYATSFQVKPVEQVQLYAVQHGSGFLLSFVEPAQCEGSNDFYPKWYSMCPLSTAGVGSEVFWSLFYLFCVFIFCAWVDASDFLFKGFPPLTSAGIFPAPVRTTLWCEVAVSKGFLLSTRLPSVALLSVFLIPAADNHVSLALAHL